MICFILSEIFWKYHHDFYTHTPGSAPGFSQAGTLSDPCIIGKKISLNPHAPTPHHHLQPSEADLKRSFCPSSPALPPPQPSPHLYPSSVSHTHSLRGSPVQESHLQASDRAKRQSNQKSPSFGFRPLKRSFWEHTNWAKTESPGSCGLLSVFICTRQGSSCCWFRATATYASDHPNTLLMTRALFAISSCCSWQRPAAGWRYLQLLSPRPSAPSICTCCTEDETKAAQWMQQMLYTHTYSFLQQGQMLQAWRTWRLIWSFRRNDSPQWLPYMADSHPYYLLIYSADNLKDKQTRVYRFMSARFAQILRRQKIFHCKKDGYELHIIEKVIDYVFL